MNVYDFDGTIYKGDSSIDFYIYSMKKRPSILKYVPKQILGFLLYSFKKIDKTSLKEYFFSFLAGIDSEKLAEEFWNCKISRIHDWYLDSKKDDDVIISASPEFLLLPICKRMEVRALIASDVDCNTGKFNSPNCRGEEKVRRLYSEIGALHIDNFYSDSLSDTPLAKISSSAYFIKRGKVQKWNVGDDS